MLRLAMRATVTCGTATVAGSVVAAPALLSGKDSVLRAALTPAGVTLAVDAGWTTARQRVVLSCPHEGLQEATLEIEGSLLWLLRGGSGQYSIRARGRGIRVRSDGQVQLEVSKVPDEPGQLQQPSGEARSSHGGGGSSISWKFPELALRLPSPTTVTVEIEDTSAVSVEALEQLSSVHPFAADIIIAGAGPVATASPITIDGGSRLKLVRPANIKTAHNSNCPRASVICASGSIPGRAQHSATLRYSGGWVDHLLALLAESGLSTRDNSGGRVATAEVDVPRVQLAHSALRWHMENGTVRFSRADVLINRQIRLASFGSYTFTGDGRRIEAVLAVPAATLRQSQLLSRALTDDREGIAMKVELTLPEPPPRGFYRNAANIKEVGTSAKSVDQVASEISSVDWVRAVQWGDVAAQLGALAARSMSMSMAAQLQQSSHDARFLAIATQAVVNKTIPKPQHLPAAPEIPGVDRAGVDG